LDRAGQTLLGKYELTRMLGKGGMGEVWEGEHQLTGRRVAVKILADNYLTNKKVVARFGREARAASAIRHDGIVEILDQDKTPEGEPFLVMEFLEGESVGERIRSRGKLNQDDALAIILPLLDALDAAHQAGIIHRDLKPDNVFILPGARGEERIKILDFGISQKSDEIENRLTQEGSVLGTPHYMSPEQARGEASIDGRVDLYAVGVMFYECVVGDVPFDAGNYNALLQIILGTPPPSPRGRGADISPAIEQVMLAAMDKERAGRPPSARAFYDLLLEASVQEDDALLDTTSWTFSTPSEPPPPLEFGDESFDGDDTAGSSAPVSSIEPPEDDYEADPFAAPPLTGTRPQPLAAGGTLGDAFVSAPPARGMHTFDSLQPASSFRAPPSSLEPPPRSPFDPAPRTGPGPSLGPPRGGGIPPARAMGGMIAPAPQFGAAPASREDRGRAARPQPRPYVAPPAPSESTLGKTILNWVLALVALGALGFLVQVLFTRPDPRKLKADPPGVEAPKPGEGAAAP
jgi:serine/threonine-protein kinase